MSNGRHGPRRNKSWSSIPGGSVGLTGNATGVTGGFSTAGLQATIMRMLGEYVVMATAGATALDRARIAVGIGVVSSDAFALGVSAMPDPGAEPDYPWLFWAEHIIRFTTSDAGELGGSIRHGFDIRSMRKISSRQTLAMIIEYTDEVGAPPLTFSAATTRILVAT